MTQSISIYIKNCLTCQKKEKEGTAGYRHLLISRTMSNKSLIIIAKNIRWLSYKVGKKFFNFEHDHIEGIISIIF